ERQFPTGIGYGVAVPHGKTPALAALVVVAGTTPAPVPYETIDGEPVRLFFLLAGPESAAGSHVKALSRISRLVRREPVRSGLAGETVVEVEGEVVARPANMRNPELATGEVEVHPSKLVIVGPAVTPAIPVARAKGEELPSEELRLKYRHLDLRRPEMQANLVLRHRLLQRARRTLSELEFLEIETPIL